MSKFGQWLSKLFMSKEQYAAYKADSDAKAAQSKANAEALMRARDPDYQTVTKGLSSSSSLDDMLKIYDDGVKQKGSPLADLFAKWTGNGLTTAQKAANALNVAEAERQRQYEERLSNTQYQRGISDMQAAGLNPGMMYGGNASPASTPSGAAGSAVPADNGMTFQDLLGLLSFPMQMAQMKANVDNTVAATKKVSSETSLNDVELQWRERTLDARVLSAELLNRHTDAEIKQIEDSRSLIMANMKESIARTQNEHERTFLIRAEKALQDANAKQILALLPYNKLLLEAQTLDQKASALSSYVHAMYEQRLIDRGFIEQQIDSMRKQASAALTSAAASMKSAKASETMAGVNAALQGFKESVYTGHVWDPNQFSGVNKYLAKGLNGFTAAVSTLATAIGGPLSGLLH